MGLHGRVNDPLIFDDEWARTMTLGRRNMWREMTEAAQRAADLASGRTVERWRNRHGLRGLGIVVHQ